MQFSYCYLSLNMSLYMNFQFHIAVRCNLTLAGQLIQDVVMSQCLLVLLCWVEKQSSQSVNALEMYSACLYSSDCVSCCHVNVICTLRSRLCHNNGETSLQAEPELRRMGAEREAGYGRICPCLPLPTSCEFRNIQHWHCGHVTLKLILKLRRGHPAK